MFVVLSLFLMVAPESAPPAAPPAPVAAPVVVPAGPPAPGHEIGAKFATTKTLSELERCLTDRLSKFGEVTSVPIEGMKTLMFRTTDEPPMMIDISPPVVTVTTKFAVWTKPIIQTCM